VPLPSVALHIVTQQQDVAEYYSPERVAMAARALGLISVLSCDIINGWNSDLPDVRALSIQLLALVRLVILSPPCTAFSALQHLWNYKRMSPDRAAAQWAKGMLCLEHAMACARKQHVEGRFFAFEHPANASSWRTPCVQGVRQLPGVLCVTIDLCSLGLVSKVRGLPIRKRTRIMTNSQLIAEGLRGHMCRCTRQHQIIEGAEGGVRRSVWAQMYPAPFVQKLAHFAAQLRAANP